MKSTGNKSKNQLVGLNQTKKLLIVEAEGQDFQEQVTVYAGPMGCCYVGTPRRVQGATYRALDSPGVPFGTFLL